MSEKRVSLMDKQSVEDFSGLPLFAIGFRPFFLLASVSAIVLVPYWLVILEQGLTSQYFLAARYHAHEMLYGFSVAVIAGFLLTAGSVWTKTRIASGGQLLLLALLWSSARLLPLFPWGKSSLPALLFVVLDLAFLPVLGVYLGRVLFAARSRRNYVFLLLLALLSLGNLLMHLEAQGLRPFGMSSSFWGVFGETLALRVITFMMLVVGGRVIPMFTRNATGKTEIRGSMISDLLAAIAFLLASIGGPLLRWALPVQVGSAQVGALFAGGLWLVAGVLGLVRMLPWGTRFAGAPLLWILHFGALCLPLAFVLEALHLWGLAPATAARHLLTVGGIGGLTLGMMARVSLGHSGRQLAAGRSLQVAFLALATATLVRALGPWLWPGQTLQLWWASGLLWALAFLLLLFFGVPIWFSKRADA